jgi:hypothetical protein
MRTNLKDTGRNHEIMQPRGRHGGSPDHRELLREGRAARAGSSRSRGAVRAARRRGGRHAPSRMQGSGEQLPARRERAASGAPARLPRCKACAPACPTPPHRHAAAAALPCAAPSAAGGAG